LLVHHTICPLWVIYIHNNVVWMSNYSIPDSIWRPPKIIGLESVPVHEGYELRETVKKKKLFFYELAFAS